MQKITTAMRDSHTKLTSSLPPIELARTARDSTGVIKTSSVVIRGTLRTIKIGSYYHQESDDQSGLYFESVEPEFPPNLTITTKRRKKY